MEKTNLTSGLRSSEVTQRRIQYGLNQLELKGKKSLIISFFEEFKDLMVIILVIATIISFAVGEVSDGSVITVIILLNATIGFMQKYRAEKAVEALKKMLAPLARVLRDGEQKMIAAEEIVPGDILILNEGDRISADGEVFHVNEFQTQEAVLTGESMPVEKSLEEGKKNVFMGTTVAHGSARVLVTQIGALTAFGKIASLTTATEKDKSPLEKELDHVGIFVGKITLVIAAILVGYGYAIQGVTISKAVLFAASVAVAAVPEGLPATVTIALAIGVQRLARKNAIMKQLSSVETLGSTTVIVSDKTGTLTKNEMTVQEVIASGLHLDVEGSGYEPKGKICERSTKNVHTACAETDKIALICALCNNAKLVPNQETNQWSILGDPTEAALLTLGEKLGLPQEKALTDAEIIHELPFDSRRKRMSVVIKKDGKRMLLVKGAPDMIIRVCTKISLDGAVRNLSEKDQEKIFKDNEEGAAKALRMIGFAYRELSENEGEKYTINETEKDLIFLGMCGIIDPARPEVAEAIELTHKAGIQVYILTGDYGLTAKAIADSIGLHSDNIITGEELQQTSDEKIRELFKNKTPTIFARVSPEDKLRIVSLLKDRGEIVAVTGDGVNDAPALKRADIGIAMGIAGTDVSKEAANMVLADDSFYTIVTAIQEGRTIYENLKKFIMYIFSSNIGELFVIFGAIILELPMPLTAIMMLLVNVGTDIFPALALGVEPSKRCYMETQPRNPTEKILRSDFIKRMTFIGIIIGTTSLLAYIIGLRLYTKETAMTLTYATLVFAQFFNAYNSRSSTESAFIKPFENGYLVGAIILSALIAVATIQIPFLQQYLKTTPLDVSQWGLVLSLGAVTLFAEEIRKYIVRHTKIAL
ncbi:MAG: cation-transporting P-type ATPase [Candidatus Peregrinibacteria bacterium]|nr:cation-transporting P-type ATPase [Candidatus Peregrinibacteria bacterium]